MKKQLELDAVLSIGKVISVKGRAVEVLVNKSKNSSILLYEGEIIRNVSVGSYLKIGKGFSELVGKIDGEFVTEDKMFVAKGYMNQKDKIKRILNISLLGYFENGEFKQGIRELPLIDNECFLLMQYELDAVHNFIKKINGVVDLKLKIGHLANETGKAIEIGINSLFASHIGIFGNTGSGKSYTLAGLYHKLFKKFQQSSNFKKNAKFLFIDFNGEYSIGDALCQEKKVYNLSTSKKLSEIEKKDKLPINSKIIINEELLSILASATDKTQKPFIKRVVKLYKKINGKEDPLEYFQNSLRRIIKDVLMMANKEKSFQLLELIESLINSGKDVDESTTLRNDLDFQNKHQYHKYKSSATPLEEEDIEETNIYLAVNDYDFPSNFIDKLLHFFNLKLIYDVLDDTAQFDHIGPAINKLKSKATDLQKVIDFDSLTPDIFHDNINICVINLNECNIDIKKIIPLMLCKNAYENHKKINREKNDKYLNMIIDEAHNILSHVSERESETWKDYRLETFEEIIKEGRKFGVFLTIASQRPSDISDTIISQLHNYFLHRLINNRDIQAVERTVSYLDKVSFDSLPILPTGTCILAGLCAHVPVIIEIDKIDDEFEPRNKTIKPTDYWN
jgi:hypothetical protein